jgi:hypothetical protein
MKKILFTIFVTVLSICYTFAQIERPAIQSKKAVKPEQVTIPKAGLKNSTTTDTTKKQPVVQTPPPPPSSTKPNSYYLVAAKVRINTGNDNKEAQSGLRIELIKNSYIPGAAPELKPYPGETLIYENRGSADEYKVNSTKELNLVGIYSKDYHIGEIWLDWVKAYGLKLKIRYSPAFVLDAWKINTVILILEVKDLKGNPHPTLGYREVLFAPNKLMKADDNLLELHIDENFLRKI